MGWVVNATPRPLYPGKESRYPYYRRLNEPKGRAGLDVCEKLALTGIGSPDLPVPRESLYELSYPDPHHVQKEL